MNLTDDNFKEETSKGIVVVIMWMPGCPACKELKPLMEEVAKECPEVQFKLMHTGKNKKTTEELKINEVPLLVMFKDGQYKARAIVSPVPSKERLIEWVKYRSTWEPPVYIPPKEPCKFCMATRRTLYSLLPRFFRTWLEKR